MIQVRPLTELDQFREVVQLQRDIWGWDDLDLLPVRFFVVANKIGGQVLGAFDHQSMGGFCIAIPGIKEDNSVYLHSHMLGLLPEWRNAGAGLALKLAQKQDALARGITQVEWSFDPLEAKNAYFNIQKLGAIIRRFTPNMYGLTSSPLQAGLPTDRCVAEWDLTKQPIHSKEVEARVTIPRDMAAIKRDQPGRAREIQIYVAQQFEQHLALGLAVTGFERGQDSGTYLFSPWPSK